MRNWLRILIWLGIMFVMGMIVSLSAGPWASTGLLFFIPMLAGLITMIMWQVMEIRVSPKSEARRAEPVKSKRHRADYHQADRLQRLVDDLDQDELIELETLLLAREQGNN
jgi:membrane protein implicated in regulation of membrane protease activity